MAVEPGTPLPWVVDPVMAWVSPATDHDAPVCALRVETDGVNREVEAAQDARYIVHACNNFPALLEALEETRSRLFGVLTQFDHAGCTCTFPSDDCCSYAASEATLTKAGAAIAKAKGAAQ